MRLQENHAKQCLTSFGIRVPNARVATEEEDLNLLIQQFTSAVTVRPLSNQATNYVVIQQDQQDNFHDVRQKLGTVNPFLTIRSLFIEDIVPISYYISVQIRTDYVTGKLLFSVKGYNNGQPLNSTKQINAFLGLRSYQARDLASDIELPQQYVTAFTQLLKNLFLCYTETDISYLRIDRLGIAPDNDFIALDAVVDIDPYALFRQEDHAPLSLTKDVPEIEYLAEQQGFNYTHGHSGIVLITNDTGISLQVIDELLVGIPVNERQPPHAIEIGNDHIETKLDSAIDIALTHSNTAIVLIALFIATLTRTELAEEIIAKCISQRKSVHFVVYLDGPSDTQDGIHLMNSANLATLAAVPTIQQGVVAVNQVLVEA